MGYPFLPYPMAFLNCMIWLFYGTVHTNSDYVIIINSVGMIIEVIFMGFYIWFADGMDLRVALIELFGMGGLGTFVALLGYLWRDTVFGYAGVVSGIIMYGSPLSVAVSQPLSPASPSPSPSLSLVPLFFSYVLI